MTKEKFKAKGQVEMQKIVNHLEGILNSFKSGKMVLEHGNDHMEFAPGKKAEMEIEAKQKDGKREFSLEFTWKEDGAGEKLDLKILSEESDVQHEKSEESKRAEGSAHVVHPEEELRHYQGTEAFGLEFAEGI